MMLNGVLMLQLKNGIKEYKIINLTDLTEKDYTVNKTIINYIVGNDIDLDDYFKNATCELFRYDSGMQERYYYKNDKIIEVIVEYGEKINIIYISKYLDIK